MADKCGKTSIHLANRYYNIHILSSVHNIFIILLATDPKLTEKKFPLVFRDSTACAMEPLPIMTKTKVPETEQHNERIYRIHLDQIVIQSAMVINLLLV